MSKLWRNSSEARASGSYPAGHRFKSHFRHHIWPVGQAVKTRPFHGCNMGSIPVRVTKIKLSRTLRCSTVLFIQAEGLVRHQPLGCMESHLCVWHHRKVLFFGLIPYATQCQFHTATSCRFHTRFA